MMFPYDKKPTRTPFPRGFDALEAELMRINQEIDKAFSEGNGFSYGFSSMSINGQPVQNDVYFQPQDGEAQHTHWENPDLNAPEQKYLEEEREPLTDVFENSDSTSVVIDLPGVDKKDIKLTSDDNILEVKVESGERKYHKKIPLNHVVKDPNAEYKNGVLEIKIARGKPKDVKID